MRDLDPSNLFEVVVWFNCIDFFNPDDSPVRLIIDGLNPWNRPIAQKVKHPVKVVGRLVRQDKSERTPAAIHLHCPVVIS
jgi:hypothetical protein